MHLVVRRNSLFAPGPNGRAKIGIRDIARELPVNHSKVVSSAITYLQMTPLWRAFRWFERKSREIWTRWRSELNSNSRFRFLNWRRELLGDNCNIATSPGSAVRAKAGWWRRSGGKPAVGGRVRGISEKPGYDVGDNMGFRPCEVHVVWGADHTSALIPPSTIAFHAGLPKAHSLF